MAAVDAGLGPRRTAPSPRMERRADRRGPTQTTAAGLHLEVTQRTSASIALATAWTRPRARRGVVVDLHQRATGPDRAAGRWPAAMQLEQWPSGRPSSSARKPAWTIVHGRGASTESSYPRTGPKSHQRSFTRRRSRAWAWTSRRRTAVHHGTPMFQADPRPTPDGRRPPARARRRSVLPRRGPASVLRRTERGGRTSRRRMAATRRHRVRLDFRQAEAAEHLRPQGAIAARYSLSAAFEDLERQVFGKD